MTVIIEKFNIKSNGFDDVIDILPKLNESFLNTEFQNGLVNVYVKSSLSGLYVGKSEDFFKLNKFLDDITKTKDLSYNSEIYTLMLNYKANFFKNSITLPVENRKILIDNQDRIFFVDFENSKKIKEIIVSMVN